ncbi:hypothetical protein [Flavobacterium sp. 3-210]
MLNFLLFITAYILYLPLSIWNFCLVENKKGYFRSSAITIDKIANREFRTLWNKKLRIESGYKFGAENETISSALGKNQRDETLTKSGKRLVKVLDFFEKDHCLKSIEN